MKDDGRVLIDLGLRRGILTPQQAAFLRDELDMFPGQKMANILLKRQFVTPEQLMDLQSQASQISSAPGQTSSIHGIRLPGAAGQRSSSGMSRASFHTRSGGGDSALGISRISMDKQLPAERKLFDYVRFAAKKGCSDLHICVNRPPFVRQHGEFHYLKDTQLTAEMSEELNLSILTDDQRDWLIQNKQIDFSFEVPEAGRVRGNIYKQRLGYEGTYRIVPEKVRTIDECGLPAVVKSLTDFSEGLILVTGSVGSGKNTSVAAMLDHINKTRKDHIVTVEDPIEHVFAPLKCAVTQREIGAHSQSFATALRASLRQDPDVIFVGEMRDLETISIAITAAETGHLVFGTLHTNSAPRTVARIVNAYPAEQRTQICQMVADSLRGIISQQLIPRKDGKGVVLALEILIFNPGISQAIKEGKTNQLISLMQAGKRYGMQTMDESLMQLFESGTISGKEAYIRAENKKAFEAVKER